MLIRILTVIAVMATMSTLHSSEAIKPQKARQKMKHLSVGLLETQITLDPLLSNNYMNYLISQCVYQGLVRLSEKSEIVGNLAESWTISDDRKTYRFKISPKAVFSNGIKVTSTDVGFSLSRHGWPNSKSVIKGYLVDHISGFKNLDENKMPSGFKKTSEDVFEITLNHPYTPFLYILAMPGFSIVPKDERTRLNSIGSGPLVPEKIGNKVSFRPNTLYSGSAPNMKKITFLTFANAIEAKKALNQGEVDVLLNLPYTKLNAKTIPEGFAFKATESLTFQHFFINNKKQIPLDVRKNIAQLIHHTVKISSIDRNFYQPITTFIPPGILPQFYQERLIESFNQSSFINSLSNIKEKIRILIPQERTSEQFILSLKSEIQKLTDMIIIEEVDLSSYRSRRNTGDYEITMFGYIGNYPDPDGFLDSIRENNFPGINVDSGQLFDEIEKIRFSKDPMERALKYAKAIRQFEDQWTVIPLFQVKLPFVIADSIKLPKTKYRYEAELWNFLWENP